MRIVDRSYKPPQVCPQIKLQFSVVKSFLKTPMTAEFIVTILLLKALMLAVTFMTWDEMLCPIDSFLAHKMGSH